MAVVLLEALGAGLLFVLIVWWTMFSGRKKGELPGQHDQQTGERDAADEPPHSESGKAAPTEDQQAPKG